MKKIDNYSEYTVVKGLIHGREKNGRLIYGVFLAVVSDVRQIYVKDRFSLDPIENDLPWDRFLLILNAPEPEKPDEAISQYEAAFYAYLDAGRVFVSDKGVVNNKVAEHNITYHCTEVLGFSAITFIEMIQVSGAELYGFLPFLKDILDEGEDENEYDEDAPQDGNGESGEIFVNCAPVIDPVHGVSAANLSTGDVVYCHLPEDSSFYKLCSTNIPNFDGVVTGDVTGVSVNEFGGAVVAVSLADGISATIKLSGSVGIKTVHKGTDASSENKNREMLFNIMIGAIAVIILICALVSLFLTP
jgi:hypothetical protein